MNSLNLNISGLPKSATLRINELSAQLQQYGRTIYKFGLGQSPFPVPEPIRQELIKNAHQKDYLPVEGLPELRRAVAGYYNRKNGLTRSGSNVIIGPGSKELMFLLQLVYYGDLVIPTPSWVSYAPQAHIIGRNVHWIPTRREDNWMLSAKELEKHCKKDVNRPRIVILNYPSNPTGSTLSESQLKDIAEVARTYNVILLSDEIYGELHHKGEHISISRFYPEGTIISGGLSKWCGAGGWRLGTFVFPEDFNQLKNAMAVAASETYTSTSAPIQYAAVAAYQDDPAITDYLTKVRKILKLLADDINLRFTSAGIQLPRVDGGFYLFPNFDAFRQKLEDKNVTTSPELSDYILEKTGVAALPGSVFGCRESDLSLRMAYVDFDGERALNMFDAFTSDNRDPKTFLKQACPKVMDGMDLLMEEIERW